MSKQLPEKSLSLRQRILNEQRLLAFIFLGE